MSFPQSRSLLLSAAAAFFLSAGLAPAVSAKPTTPSDAYQMPAAQLAELVDAPNTPEMRIDPKAQWLILCNRPFFLTIEDLSKPEAKLAGLRFNPATRASGRDKYYTGLSIRPLKGGIAKPVQGLPSKSRIGSLYFSPDGNQAAFALLTDRESQLWMLDCPSGTAKQVAGLSLTAWAGGFDINWSANGDLTVLAAPEQAGPAPRRPLVPEGPNVQEHTGGKASARTYQDLLKSPQDEAQFEYYSSCQVVRIPKGGSPVRVTPVASYSSVSPSPDGKYLLVSSIHRPYTYSQTVSSFPEKVEVLTREGKRVKVLADLPLEENAPPDYDSVRPGPRAVQWRGDVPATLFWAETLDGGDARKAVDFREQLYTWSPGQASANPWFKLKTRFGGIHWGTGEVALVREGWHKTRKTQTHLVQPDHAEVAPVTIFDRSSEDRYNDPGEPFKKTNSSGRSVLLLGDDQKSIFLDGKGASPQGERPFVDRLNLTTKQTQRLFQSQDGFYEKPVRLLDSSAKKMLTTRESVDTPPNLWLRDLGDPSKDQLQGVSLTDFKHPAPQLRGVTKQILRYKRSDGVNLTGTLYTPPGYDKEKDGRLPVFVWAYPGEFKNAASAGQIKGSPYKFIRPWWGGPLFFAARGYAVLEDPTFPIIGEGDKEPNDTYVEQLVMDAKAAVDAVAATGIGDLDRCAIGGHSYGAFTVANLLAHSDLFRAGIARSGAYNRTLTPFGFQSEERTYWEARDVYLRMAPFNYADKINEPLLLIHGAEDSNPGTFPIQSERLFQAVKGLGGQVRLVMLPKESHGYAARESVMHTMYEMDNWLEKYVKNAKPRVKTATPVTLAPVEENH